MKHYLYFLLCFMAGMAQAGKYEDLDFVQWQNPIPRIADMGLDMQELVSLLGKGQLLLVHKPRSLSVWTARTGKVETYPEARLISALAVINASAGEIHDKAKNIENFPDFMPQFTEARLIKANGQESLGYMKQVYKLFVLTLEAPFVFQYRYEPNGDIGSLLREGDVGAGVTRTELIPLAQDKTLLVQTGWVDMDSARLVFRTLLKAQPDIKPTAPVGASALVMQQMKDHMDPLSRLEPGSADLLEKTPVIPVYARNDVARETLLQLTKLGTVLFVHDRQWINDQGEVAPIQFVTAIGRLHGNIEKIRPVSSDFSRFPEYFRQVRKVRIEQQDDSNLMDWKFRFGLGVIGVGVDFRMRYDWLNRSTVTFSGVGGDIRPLFGAWEWIPAGDDTLLVFTAANSVSDEASWVLKLARRLPNLDILSGIFMSMLIVEKQQPWLKAQMDG